jgi:hypothetical protein
VSTDELIVFVAVPAGVAVAAIAAAVTFLRRRRH